MIKELIDNLLNPKNKEKIKNDIKHELKVKFDKSLYLKDYLKSRAWLEFNRPIVYKSLEVGMGKLIRDGLTMSEVEIKAIIADMRANLNQVEEMRYSITTGEDAGHKLEKLK